MTLVQPPLTYTTIDQSWAQIDAGSTHFYKTRFVLQCLGMIETAQTVSLGQWKAKDPGLNPVDDRILYIFSSMTFIGFNPYFKK